MPALTARMTFRQSRGSAVTAPEGLAAPPAADADIDKALQGRTGASARFPEGNRSSAGAGGAKRSRMPRRGCHRQVTGGGRVHDISGERH